MYKETNTRSIVKGISWRVVATTTTIAIVYFFFDRLDLAIAAGMIETVLKVGLYWAHERAWFKVSWGRKKIEPFNLWFTGISLSGKTTIGDLVYKELEKEDIYIIKTSNLKDIKIRKRFLSKIINITIHCKDSTSFTIAAPHALKYIPIQHENVDNFLKIYHNT